MKLVHGSKKVENNTSVCQLIKWINKMWYIEYYSSIKRNGILIHEYTPIWMNPENITLSETRQSQNTMYVGFHLQDMPRTGKSIQSESRLMDA